MSFGNLIAEVDASLRKQLSNWHKPVRGREEEVGTAFPIASQEENNFMVWELNEDWNPQQ